MFRGFDSPHLLSEKAPYLRDFHADTVLFLCFIYRKYVRFRVKMQHIQPRCNTKCNTKNTPDGAIPPGVVNVIHLYTTWI